MQIHQIVAKEEDIKLITAKKKKQNLTYSQTVLGQP